MFGIGTTELILIGIVALIVVGPKDLPGLFRSVGQFTGKARGMAREFTRAMEDAADQSGMRDVSDTLRAAANPRKAGMDALKGAGNSILSDDKPEAGPETTKLSEERAEAARKISENAAKMATERKAREAALAEAGTPPVDTDTPAAKAPASKKPAARKPAAKKPAAKKPAAKPAAKKPAAASAAKKPAAKRAAKPKADS